MAVESVYQASNTIFEKKYIWTPDYWIFNDEKEKFSFQKFSCQEFSCQKFRCQKGEFYDWTFENWILDNWTLDNWKFSLGAKKFRMSPCHLYFCSRYGTEFLNFAKLFSIKYVSGLCFWGAIIDAKKKCWHSWCQKYANMKLTFMPCHLEMARRGLSALNVLSDLRAVKLALPSMARLKMDT